MFCDPLHVRHFRPAVLTSLNLQTLLPRCLHAAHRQDHHLQRSVTCLPTSPDALDHCPAPPRAVASNPNSMLSTEAAAGACERGADCCRLTTRLGGHRCGSKGCRTYPWLGPHRGQSRFSKIMRKNIAVARGDHMLPGCLAPQWRKTDKPILSSF